MSKKAGISMRVWISADDVEHLRKLAEETGLAQTELITRILHSGLSCVVQNQYQLVLPLVFEMQNVFGGARSQMALEDAPIRKKK